MLNGRILNSRERILRTIMRKETDRTPVYLRLWSTGGEDRIPFEWSDQFKRAEYLTGIGVDDTLLLQPPFGYIEDYDANKVPGVKQRVELIPASGPGEYPLLKKVYETPEGDLTHLVKKTEDWIYGDDIYLFSDYNVSRAVQHIIREKEDIPKLVYLLGEPDDNQMAEFARYAAKIRLQAERLGVAIDGGWVALGDAAVDLCGMERVMMAQFDEPEFLEELLDVLLAWEMRRVNLILNEGADVVVYMAWYEGSDFWTPKSFRRILKPRIKALVDLVHERGALFRYIITKGSTPILEDLAEIGVDCITGIDPVQDRINMEDVKAKYGNHFCLMGGVNAAVMFTQWSEEKIRESVRNAMEKMSEGGGFILFPVDNIFCDMPWDRVEVFIDEWRKNCKKARE